MGLCVATPPGAMRDAEASQIVPILPFFLVDHFGVSEEHGTFCKVVIEDRATFLKNKCSVEFWVSLLLLSAGIACIVGARKPLLESKQDEKPDVGSDRRRE